jgi:F-type H+-transporting ATPase subunit b
MAETANPVTQTQVGQESGDAAGFPPFNTETFPSQLFWFAIVFIVLYVTMARVALPRIASIFKNRANRVAKDLAEANALQGQVEEARLGYEKTLSEAKASAQALAQSTRTSLAKDAEAKRKTLDAELQARLVDAEKQIALVKIQAMSHVDEIAREAATTIVQHLSGQNIDAGEIAKAVSSAKAV